MYDFLKRSRCKPWDNRELDCLEGFKLMGFVFYTLSQTCVFILFTVLINFFEIFSLLRNFLINVAISCNLGLEIFIFTSSFLGFYKAMQIMDARNALLGPRDIFKIWMRKWMRLAPIYYSMWLLVWSITSRLSEGPLWWFAQMNTATCADNWIPTVFMAGNLYNPGNMDPYAGCYQIAWPLQLDMQIAIFIPFLAMIMWWRQSIGCLICALMIVLNVVINMLLTKHYDLTIGLVDDGNYFLL